MFFLAICLIGIGLSLPESSQELRIEQVGVTVKVTAQDRQQISFVLPEKARAGRYNPDETTPAKEVGITHPNFQGVLFLSRDDCVPRFKWRLTAVGIMPNGKIKSFWMPVDATSLQKEINALPQKR